MFVHSRFLLGIIALVSFILFISWRFTSNPSDDQLLSNWYPKNVKDQMCRRNTSYLIEQMQDTQRQLSSHIQKHFTSLDKHSYEWLSLHLATI
ncbi:hypothetical protein M3Y98_00060900 [Aphelenchoides besseyi]|nr:hypothetical protein M3Y98_00060900 [Aphelenchoides besseyi]